MKRIYDQVARQCSALITRKYSTSFSMGIYFLDKKLRDPTYSIYGFVRLADEIVDSFDGYDQTGLLADLRAQTFRALEAGISSNPVLHSFQETVHRYNIEPSLIETFLDSMEMDLTRSVHDHGTFEAYILGSAEVVGLMCLWVFCEGDRQRYEKLRGRPCGWGPRFRRSTSCGISDSTITACTEATSPTWILRG